MKSQNLNLSWQECIRETALHAASGKSDVQIAEELGLTLREFVEMVTPGTGADLPARLVPALIVAAGDARPVEYLQARYGGLNKTGACGCGGQCLGLVK